MEKVAFDIGFGFTKGKKGDRLISFPTAIKRIDETLPDIDEGKYYVFENEKYIVGEKAVRESIVIRDYTAIEKYAPLLLYVALEELGVDLTKEIAVSTGISYNAWSKREAFSNRLMNTIVNNTKINIAEFYITSQGKGIYLDAIAKEPTIKDKLCLVIDFGTYTVHGMWFEGGESVKNKSWCIDRGSHEAIDKLRTKIDSEFQTNSTQPDINRSLISNKIFISGGEKDITTWTEEIKTRYFRDIMTFIQTKDDTLYKRAEVVVIAGGGAKLGDKHLPDHDHYIYIDNPQFSNVNGYYSRLE